MGRSTGGMTGQWDGDVRPLASQRRSRSTTKWGTRNPKSMGQVDFLNGTSKSFGRQKSGVEFGNNMTKILGQEEDGWVSSSSQPSDDELAYGTRPRNTIPRATSMPVQPGTMDFDMESRLMATVAGTTAPFMFEKRRTRIDWRKLHGIDVDRVVREADIDTLESILDTIAFGDIEAEDTRNFTEFNFVKIFRLSQLMVEYLLHVQETLASHKSQLVVAGATVQRKTEKLRTTVSWHRDALAATRRDLKQAKKTLSTYEILLRLHGHGQGPAPSSQQTHKCPTCDKLFESAYYLDLHMARRHPRPPEEDPKAILAAAVAKAEETTTIKVRAETTAQLQAEFQEVLARTRADFERAEQAANTKVVSLQAVLASREREMEDLRARIEELQRAAARRTGAGARLEEDDPEAAHAAALRVRELEGKVAVLEQRHRLISEEKEQLTLQLEAAKAEVTSLKAERRRLTNELEDARNQVDDLERQKKRLTSELARAKKSRQPAGEKVKVMVAKLEEPSREDRDTDRRRSEEERRRRLAQNERDDAAARRRSEDERRRRELELEERNAAARKKTEEEEAEEARQRAAAAAAAALQDIGDETPWLSVADKEKWLREHPYAPVPEKPMALAKYPHEPTLFPDTRTDITQHFDDALAEELRKFGITAGTKGMSDEAYAEATAILEQRRTARLAEAPAAERKQMEYERGTIQWHIERAVHARDEAAVERRLRSSLNEEDEPEELTFEEATGGTRGGGNRGNDYREASGAVVKHVIGNPASLRSSLRTDYTASEVSAGSAPDASPDGRRPKNVEHDKRVQSEASGSDSSASDDVSMDSDISVHDDVASEEASEEMSEPEVYSKPNSRRPSNANSDKTRGAREEARGKKEGGAWAAAKESKAAAVSRVERRKYEESVEERSPTEQEKAVSSVEEKRKEMVLTAADGRVADSEAVHVVQLVPSRRAQDPVPAPVQTVKIGAAFSDGNRGGAMESRRALSPLRPASSAKGSLGGRLKPEGAGFRGSELESLESMTSVYTSDEDATSKLQGSSGRYDSPAGSGPAKSSTGATSKEQKPVTKTAPRDYLDDFETDDIEEITI